MSVLDVGKEKVDFMGGGEGLEAGFDNSMSDSWGGTGTHFNVTVGLTK